MIDINQLDTETEVTFDVPVVFDEKGDAVAGFKVVGRNSDKFRTALRKQEVAAIKRSGVRGGNKPDPKTDDGAAYYLDNAAENEMNIATACVVDWYGFSKDGEVLKLTPDAVKSVFEKRPTWREAVTAAIEVDANFTKA